MATEEPVGFTEDGKLVTAYRFSDAELADIMMAGQMWCESPDGLAAIQRALEGLPHVSMTVTIEGGFDTP